MPARPRLSLVVITKNEERTIAGCLKSAAFCDETVVVDSFSTDRTAEIARALGARVIARTFDGYGSQKSFAVSQAQSPWVLLLDADEQATYELGQEITAVLASPHPCDGYRVRRLLYHLGGYYGDELYRDRPLRLFRRACARVSPDPLHEKVVVDGRVGQLKAPILHFSYRDVADHVATMNRFSSEAALMGRPSALSALRMFTHPAWRFVRFYIVRGGWLQGGRGLYAAMSAAFYGFLKHAKQYEQWRRSRRPR